MIAILWLAEYVAFRELWISDLFTDQGWNRIIINSQKMRKSMIVWMFLVFPLVLLNVSCAYWCQASAKYTDDHSSNKPIGDISYNPVNGKVASVNLANLNVNIYNADLSLIQKYS